MFKNDSNIKRKRRKAIVDIARKMISEKGIFGASILEIAQSAGIGRSTMYEYFKTKEELLIYIRELYLEKMYDIHIDISEQSSGIAQLETLLNHYFEAMLENREALIYFMEFNRLFKDQKDAFLIETYSSHSLFLTAIETGRKDGTLNIPHIEKTITIIMETLIAAATRFAVKDEYSYTDNNIRINRNDMGQIIQFMLYGINRQNC